jgi:hypothetical protein
MFRHPLGNDPLFAARTNLNHTTARVCSPKCSVSFGQNALRALQIAADVPDRSPFDTEVQN